METRESGKQLEHKYIKATKTIETLKQQNSNQEDQLNQLQSIASDIQQSLNTGNQTFTLVSSLLSKILVQFGCHVSFHHPILAKSSNQVFGCPPKRGLSESSVSGKLEELQRLMLSFPVLKTRFPLQHYSLEERLEVLVRIAGEVNEAFREQEEARMKLNGFVEMQHKAIMELTGENG